MNNLGEAIAIASHVFKDRKDKSGNPYILHCIWVMNAVRHLGVNYMIAAILHDLIEDCPEWTIEMLEKSFTKDITIAIDILTHKVDDSYDEYIQMISHNDIARQVKLRDLEHNSKITRLKGLNKNDIDRMYKYHKAYTYLK